MAAHRHRNTLKKERFSLFEKIMQSVYKRGQGCKQRNQLGYPDAYKIYFYHLIFSFQGFTYRKIKTIKLPHYYIACNNYNKSRVTNALQIKEKIKGTEKSAPFVVCS
jgi:hypothetical protein